MNVRPARTAAIHAANENASPSASRANVRYSPTGMPDDILSVPATSGSR